MLHHEDSTIVSDNTSFIAAAGVPPQTTGDIMKPRTPVTRRAIARPNCTHIDMDRLFGPHQCQLCWKFPSFGWVYVCRQDNQLPFNFPSAFGDDLADLSSKLREELDEVGLSRSVIETAKKGLYTAEQLEQLKAQKRRVREVIAMAMDPDSNDNNLPNNDGANASHLENKQTQVFPQCSFKVCHACRPYYKDRIYVSFGAVFAGELRPLTRQDVKNLPSSNVYILRTIGLRQPPQKRHLTDESPALLASSTSQYTFKSTQSERDDINQIRRAMGWRNSLKNTFHIVFKTGRESSSEGSNITLPLPGTGKHRPLDEDARDFDLNPLKRIRSHRRRTLEVTGTGSLDVIDGVEVSNGEGSSETSEEHQDTSSTSSDYSAYSAMSEGSEVEVDGGVALTEEAVEMHTPDIITQDTPLVLLQGLDDIITQA
ncbi:hypothetical protein K432DRAFT_225425 [Lepidopterella palustris CBS 459.81]|uniref:Uncharacterized protein n=1 Tax=Lepidopterella palustris CBS 459.81 TaxID=1314670 RepID=A0A8E2EE86_9PEZI|nr:hypothetical protein K432DRAFT_225425 [Lepidopterella palustris CBS 459.81]